MPEVCFEFGEHRFLAGQRILLLDDRPVELPPHLAALLLTLLERSGRIVPHDELAASLWSGLAPTGVKANAQIAELLALLVGSSSLSPLIEADDRGAWISAEVTQELLSYEEPAPSGSFVSNVPPLQTRLIGRSNDVASALGAVQTSRLVSLVGPGGVGKTSIALSVATAWQKLSRAPVLFVDLTDIADPDLLWTTMLGAMNVNPAYEPRATALGLLRDSSALLLFDNCEHIVEGVAEAIGVLLARCRSIRVLATTREELRSPHEVVAAIRPLDVPSEDDVTTASTASDHAAVELLFDRLRARLPEYRADDEEAASAASLCRKLDGMPLAIELAAARVGEDGVGGILAQLSSRFELLQDGSRRPTDRHAGLLTVLDWSYGLLTTTEQSLLRYLSVFPADFTIDDALAVAPTTFPKAIVTPAIYALLSKSMLSERGDAVPPRLRLLESTREYGLAKLDDADEKPPCFSAFSAHILNELRKANPRDREATLALWKRHRNNTATALEWTLSAYGDRKVGVDIVAAALPIWMLLSEISRYGEVLRLALQAIEAGLPDRVALVQPFEFARSIALYFAVGPNAEGLVVGRRAYEKALALDDTQRHLDTAWVLHAQSIHWGNYADGLSYARRYLRVARRLDDPLLVNKGWRLICWGYDSLGNHRRGEKIFENIVEATTWDLARHAPIWSPDAELVRLTMRSRYAWFADRKAEAMQAVSEAVTLGTSDGLPHSLCNMLALYLIPMALWEGGFDLARQYTTLLAEQARNDLDPWSKWSEMLFEGIDVAAGARPSASLIERIERSWPFRQEIFATFHPSLAVAGILNQAQSPGFGSWSQPELLRVRAGQLLEQGYRHEASKMLTGALALARERGSRPFAARLETALNELG